jgi:hypothetical protein
MSGMCGTDFKLGLLSAFLKYYSGQNWALAVLPAFFPINNMINMVFISEAMLIALRSR